MAYEFDRCESTEAYWAERAEQGFADRAVSQATCGEGHHSYMPNSRGGGTCRWCGDELDREDL